MMQGPAAKVVTRAILFRDGLKVFFFLDFANVDWDPVGGGGGEGMFALAFFFLLRTRRLNKLKKVKEYRGLVKS